MLEDCEPEADEAPRFARLEWDFFGGCTALASVAPAVDTSGVELGAALAVAGGVAEPDGDCGALTAAGDGAAVASAGAAVVGAEAEPSAGVEGADASFGDAVALEEAGLALELAAGC